MLEFQLFDPARCQFPSPRVAPLPALNWADLTLGRDDTTSEALISGVGVWHFARGRYALEAAYRSAGIGPTGSLLAPAYHCRTMLDPAFALGGAIHLYALNGDLTPQIESIKTVVAARQPAVRALVIPHYFGFEQPDALMRELASFCSQQGIMLIEDCSHAWQVAIRRAPACQARMGHVVVASPYKFFACTDGGMLWGNPSQLQIAKQSHPGLLSEAKAIKAAFRRSGVQPLPTLEREPFNERTAHGGQDLVESSDQPSRQYDRALEGRSSLAVSRWLMRRTRLTPAVQRRRNHYREWTDAVSGLQGGHALFPDLSLNCAPYMFPFYIAAPDPKFFLLKQAGLPIWRWDEMAVSDCQVASEYRLHLLHLPCHQSLTSKQMRWMTNTVVRVLA